MARTRFGINLPQSSIGSLESPSYIAEYATQAENLGFDSVWVLERFLRKSVACLDSIGLLTFAAAVTTRVNLGSAVVMTPLRSPLILAKQISTLDYLSNGRLILGIALGGHEDEYSAAGMPINQRARRFVDGLSFMKKLWNEENVSFHSDAWNVDSAEMLPRPVQRPHPPIWIGSSFGHKGKSERPLRRVAELADGWLGGGSSSLEEWKLAWERVKYYAREIGRDPSTIRTAKRIYIHIDNDPTAARAALSSWLTKFYSPEFPVDKTSVYGSVDKCLERLDEHVKAGIEHIILTPIVNHAEQMRTYAKDILPSFE